MLGDVEVDWSMPRGFAVRSLHQVDGVTDDLLVAIPLPGRGRYRMSMLVPPELERLEGDTKPDLGHIQAVLDRLAPEPTTAHNLRWSWHHETLDLFRAVDPELLENVKHDPVRLLGEVSQSRSAFDPSNIGSPNSPLSVSYSTIRSGISRMRLRKASATCSTPNFRIAANRPFCITGSGTALWPNCIIAPAVASAYASRPFFSSASLNAGHVSISGSGP